MANTLFDKIWDKHVVQLVEDGPTQLYIDRDWRGGHAGGQETAAILAIRPEDVDVSAYEPARMRGISTEMPASGKDFLYARP